MNSTPQSAVTFAVSTLAQIDPDIAKIIESEKLRQKQGLELIASENYASRAVLEAVGSVLTNKYAEGYPSKRYYNGCEYVDQAEALAIERAKKLFGAFHANVQPHSGTQANLGAYTALIKPGDTVLAMSLAQGGHLTHGAGVNLSGQLYKFIGYGVHKETETLDYDEIARLAQEHRPKLIVAGATAYPRAFDFARIGAIAKSVGALFMVDMAHIAGLVAARVHPDPIPIADVVTTTTHKTLRGPRGGMIFATEAYAKAVDKAIFPGSQGGPLEHVIAGKAVALKEALAPGFSEYQKQIIANARALAQQLQTRGIRLVSGGTDNHLILVDLTRQKVSGKDAANALHAVGITCNKNLIPFDTQSPNVTSGVRIGTPAVTTRGMRENDMRQIADWIADVVTQMDDAGLHSRVRDAVVKFASQFPMPGVDE
ncbi:MAG: serine hydroxymethyltransferase [Chloroflexi bacterium]|nr:serine hydroxymethyltransferase [Chloroflexota bacterium]